MKKIVLFSIITLSLLAIFFILIPAFSGDLVLIKSFEIGQIKIRWYGLVLASAILTGYLIARNHAWKFGIGEEEVDNLSFWLTIAGILGARIYFILFDFRFFFENPSEVYKIWHGGLSIYGAIISGLIFIFIYTRRRAFTFGQIIDLLALSLPLSQALGRVGNFFNYEAFGLPTSLPWKMFVPQSFRPQGYESFDFFHPVFLYEGMALVVVFFIVKKFLNKLPMGALGLIYLLSYSLIRFFTEFLRLDSVFISSVKVDQAISLGFFLLAAWALTMLLKSQKTRHSSV